MDETLLVLLFGDLEFFSNDVKDYTALLEVVAEGTPFDRTDRSESIDVDGHSR